MRDKPKECNNNGCRNIFYVPDYRLPLPLICEKCQTKSNEKPLPK